MFTMFQLEKIRRVAALLKYKGSFFPAIYGGFPKFGDPMGCPSHQVPHGTPIGRNGGLPGSQQILHRRCAGHQAPPGGAPVAGAVLRRERRRADLPSRNGRLMEFV